MFPQSSPYLLYADKNPSSRKAFESYFSASGWKLDVVPDGFSALDSAIKNDYDIVITDLEMPDLNGMEILKKLHIEKPTQAVIVLAETASLDGAVESFRSGAIDYLVKPVEYAKLKHAIVKLMKIIQEEQRETRLFGNVVSENTSYEFTTRDLSSVNFVLPIISKLYLSQIINQHTKLQLTLAFQEALANSLEHGNLALDSKLRDDVDDRGVDRFSISKKERLSQEFYGNRRIFINSLYRDKKLSISIRDEGIGFKPPVKFARKIGTKIELGGVNQTVSSEALQTYGRGLTLLMGVLDEVSFNDDGTEITLVKRL